jgi:Holliday junction resolvase
MPSEYAYGRRKELQVGEFLRRRRFECRRARGSRGPIDLVARRGGHRLAIQVKSTRLGCVTYTRLGPSGETRLIRAAVARRAKPALALVSRNYVWLVSVPGDEVILEGELKPLQYEYPEHT